jgi:hypothetical protein
MNPTMQFTTLTTLALSATTALAASAIPSHTQSCTAKDNLINSAHYTMYVGEPFNQAACDSFSRVMMAHYCGKADAGDLTDCIWLSRRKDKQGQFELTWENKRGQGPFINQAAHMAWLLVNGFNCPDW